MSYGINKQNKSGKRTEPFFIPDDVSNLTASSKSWLQPSFSLLFCFPDLYCYKI